MSILKDILSKAKSQDLEDGIHDNCRILAIDISVRKDKDDVNIKRNTYVTLGKFDKTGTRKIAEKEIAWFNIDPSSEYVMDNFREQVIQFTGILYCYYDVDEINEKFNIFKGVEGFEDAMNDETELDVDAIEAALKVKKTAQILLVNAITLFYKMMEGKFGYESDLIQIKLTFDKSGKYIQQPNYGKFTRAMDDEQFSLKMSKVESNYSTSARDYDKIAGGVDPANLDDL